MYTKQGLASLAVFSAALAVPLQEREASSSSSAYLCNPAHSYPGGVICDATSRTLIYPSTTSATAATTSAYLCNPAHSYPGGVSCDPTSRTLIYPSTTSASASTSSAYLCNPAHSYPGGVSCDATSRTLIYPSTTSAPAATTSAYKCNPAHSYPGGVTCDGTALTLIYPSTTSAPAATTSAYLCNPAHSYPGGVSCDATSRTLIYPSTTESSASFTATVPASTETGSAGLNVVPDLTWTAANLTRYCLADNSGCDYNFVLTASDDRSNEACTISRYEVGDANTESWSDQECTAGSSYVVSWGYSAQFGVENAFAVLTVVDNDDNNVAYFGVANVNSQPVSASSPAGSSNFGNIGPQPVYSF